MKHERWHRRGSRHGHDFHHGHGFHHAHGWRDGRLRSLRYQLFVWLSVTIATTGLVVGLVFRLLGTGGPSGPEKFVALQSVVAGRFAQAWADPQDRNEFARGLHQALGVQLVLRDEHGVELARFGEMCPTGPVVLPIARDGRTVGQVEGCFGAIHGNFAGTGLAALGTALIVLWGAAAFAARRITRPLSQLIAVTREIGSGSLSARVRLGRYGRGEIKVLADAVNDMARRIERQLQEHRELLAVVSHELRSPLARIRVCSELLRGAPASIAMLDAIDREVTEVDTLLGKLLAHSRLDFGVLSPSKVEAVILMRTAFDRHVLGDAELIDETEGVSVHVDATLVARALDNLLDNAERHGMAPIAGRLRMEERAGQSCVVFEVSDGGLGIAPEIAPRVFDAFYRTGEAHGAAVAGLGLGLSLVKRIAEAHGGVAFTQPKSATERALVGFSVAVRRPG